MVGLAFLGDFLDFFRGFFTFFFAGFVAFFVFFTDFFFAGFLIGFALGFTTIPASFSIDALVISITAGAATGVGFITTGKGVTDSVGAGEGGTEVDGTAGSEDIGRGAGGFLNRLLKALFWLGVGVNIARYFSRGMRKFKDSFH